MKYKDQVISRVLRNILTVRYYSGILLGMIRIPARIYDQCSHVRRLGDYISFNDYFMVHKDFMKPTGKQQALIDLCTKRSKDIVRDTAALMSAIKEELSSELRGIEATNELREIGTACLGHSLGRVFAQLSTQWDRVPLAMNEDYFQAIIRKTDYMPWQRLNSPHAPILVCQGNLRPSKLSAQVVALVMPFMLRK